MPANSTSARLAAYQSAASQGAAAEADAHRLIWLLMDGALDRIAMARGCMERGEITQKAALLHRVVAIVDELKASLNLQAGGLIAANLDSLYVYISQRVMLANLENRVDLLDECAKLLRPIRDAWVTIAPQARAFLQVGAP